MNFLSEAINAVLTDNQYRYNRSDLFLMNNPSIQSKEYEDRFVSMMIKWNEKVEISSFSNVYKLKLKNILLAYVSASEEIYKSIDIIPKAKILMIDALNRELSNNLLNGYINFMRNDKCISVFDQGIINGILPDELLSYKELILKLLVSHDTNIVVSSIADYIRETSPTNIINKLINLKL